MIPEARIPNLGPLSYGEWHVTSGLGYIFGGGFMDLLAAIKREERKLEKQLGKLQHDLNRVRAAAEAFGNSTGRNATRVKNRVLSAAARAKISRATKKRWAQFRARAKKLAG